MAKKKSSKRSRAKAPHCNATHMPLASMSAQRSITWLWSPVWILNPSALLEP